MQVELVFAKYEGSQENYKSANVIYVLEKNHWKYNREFN